MPTLGIKHRLLVSHLFAVVVLAGAFGAFVYAMAAQQVKLRLQAQLTGSAALIAGSLDDGGLALAEHQVSARQALIARLQTSVKNYSDLARVDVVRHDALGDHLIASSAAQPVATPGAGDAGYLTTRAPISGGGNYLVVVHMRSDDVAGKLYILRLSAALAFLVCVLAALILSRDLARRILVRITDLAARCRALANGDPLPPRRAGPRDELDELTREFDAMAGRLRHAAESGERANAALSDAYGQLESRVRERTAALEDANSQLKNEIESRVHVEALLAEAALTDPLTGLLNRRAMMEMLGQAAALLQPGEPGVSVIVADIDHFKRVNDVHGHGYGDQVLVATAKALLSLAGDAHQHNVARWGGEEFLILLPNVRLAAACKHAEQIRRSIAALRVGDEGLRVTLSLGVAELIADEHLDDCLRRCDQALYRAKDAGRNTVVAAQGALFATMS
ncbi:MAG: diguanylate cyclase [Rudaea sp.]